MDHTTAQNRLSAYIDNELPPEPRAVLEAHLAACPICSTQLQNLQQTSALLRQLPIPTPNPALLTRLHATLDNSTRRAIGGVERFVGLLSGIAACLAVIGGLMLMRPAAAASSPAPWENNAVQLSDDSAASPGSSSPENTIGQWMVASLSSRGDQ